MTREAAINNLLRAAIVLAVPLAAIIGWTLGAPPEKPGLQAAAVAPAAPPEPLALIIRTTRRGHHHIVRAAVVGRDSKIQVVPFLVDTGASAMALPTSMIEELGYDPNDLEDWLVETANGRIRVKKGRLTSLELGGPDGSDTLRDVEVMFIADDALGHPLLGMNVLGRYRVTIDDDNDQIILVKKR